MSREEDVITVVMEVGKKIMVHAKGEPAKTVAYALIAGGAMVATGLAYGSYKYGGQALEWLRKK